MAVKKLFAHKNIKKKVQVNTKGFEIKLITTIISGLFLSHAAVAHEYVPNNKNYRDVQQTAGKDIVFDEHDFQKGQEYPKGITADSFTAKNSTFKDSVLYLREGYIDIGAITIFNTNDIYNDEGHDPSNSASGASAIVGINLFNAQAAHIGSVHISNSSLNTKEWYWGVFDVAGDDKQFSVDDVFLENIDYYGIRNRRYGIKIQNCNITKPINSLKVDGLHFHGVLGEAINLYDNNKTDLTYYSINTIDVNNVISDLDVTGLYIKGSDKVIVKEKTTIKNLTAPYAKGVFSLQGDLQFNNLEISNINGEDAAIAIVGTNITVNKGITIGEINSQSASYAIYAAQSNNDRCITIKGGVDIINKITGDIAVKERSKEGAEGKVTANFMNTNSFFTGKVVTIETLDALPNGINGECNLTFDNGAHWAVTGDSWTTNLHVGNGAYVDLMADKNPTRLKASKFTANGGSLNLHFDPTKLHDVVEIDEGSGTFDIVLDVSNGNQIKKADWDNYIITQNKGKLHLGKVTYKDGATTAFKVAYWTQDSINGPGSLTSTGEDGRWIVYLPEIIDGLPLKPPSKFPATPLVPANPVDPEIPLTPLVPAVPQSPGNNIPPTTPEVDQILALGTSAAQGLGMLQETEDLRTRMGDIRSGESDGVWARTFARQDRAYGSYGHSFKQETYGIYFGADRAWRHNSGSSLVGLAMHLGKSDQKEIGGGEAGSAKMDQYSLKAYGTWMSDRGSFIDIVGLLGYYDTELNGVSNTGKRQLKADYNTWGYGLSAEIGHRFALEQPTSTWFVEPTAQLSWYRVLGKDFSTNTGIKVEQSDTDFLVGRAGLAVGKTIPLGQNDGQSLTFTLRGGMLYQFDGDQTIKVSGTDDSSLKLQALSMNGARAYYGSTVDWRIDDAWRLYGQISREEGSGYTKDYDFSVGVQYRW